MEPTRGPQCRPNQDSSPDHHIVTIFPFKNARAYMRLGCVAERGKKVFFCEGSSAKVATSCFLGPLFGRRAGAK